MVIFATCVCTVQINVQFLSEFLCVAIIQLHVVAVCRRSSRVAGSTWKQPINIKGGNSRSRPDMNAYGA